MALNVKLAERVGFEPTVGLNLRLISSQVHSTTLPPLLNRCCGRLSARGRIIAAVESFGKRELVRKNISYEHLV